jgi:diacylglycerol kinase (ATP)
LEAAIIYNPVAGSGSSETVSALAEAHLVARGWKVQRLATRDESGAAPIARELGKRVERVVVVGGDGSLREVIEGLGGDAERIVIGVVPTGNANVLARELGISLVADEAIRLLSEGEPRAIDVGFAEGRIFLAMAGIGWDARVVRLMSRLRATRWGGAWYRLWADSAYALAGVWEALRPGAVALRLQSDGRDVGLSFRALVVSNTRVYGKGWSMVPDAHVTSGQLHYQGRRRSALPFVAWAVLAARFRRRAPPLISHYGAGRRLVVEADRDFPLQIDGDFRGFRRRFEAEVRVGAVRILGAPEG